MLRRLIRSTGWYLDAARLLASILFGTGPRDSAQQTPRRW